MKKKDIWPMLSFGPINLYSVVPADLFYATPEQQWEMVWKDRNPVPHQKPSGRIGVAPHSVLLMQNLLQQRRM